MVGDRCRHGALGQNIVFNLYDAAAEGGGIVDRLGERVSSRAGKASGKSARNLRATRSGKSNCLRIRRMSMV